MNKSITFFIILLAIWLLFFKAEPKKVLAPGVMAHEIPFQSDMTIKKPFEYQEFTITPLADFKITAKILAKEYYNYDDEAKVSFLDIALGWGEMSDQSIVDQFEITQSGRWYRWQSKTNSYPIPRREIEQSSANMHMIASNEFVKQKLQNSRVGDIIKLSGYLVEVQGEGHWRWKSSLTRKDTGAGACELIWVEDFSVITP